MRKVRAIFYCSILLVFCQVMPVGAIAENQEKAIVAHCDAIKDDLKNVQKIDARTRIYLGGYYETIQTKFITPLNVRLVENSLSTAGFVENQNKFAEARTNFLNDYIGYQRNLEELVAMDCKNEPGIFYEKLEKVRQKRKVVGQDVLRIRNLISENTKLVRGLEAKL